MKASMHKFTIFFMLIFIAFPSLAQGVTYRSENLESYRGKRITLIGEAHAVSSNALTRSVSGCAILLNAKNATFAVRVGSPRTSWAKIYIPCDAYQQAEGKSRKVSVSGVLETWYAGKFVRGANVIPLNMTLESVRVTPL